MDYDQIFGFDKYLTVFELNVPLCVIIVADIDVNVGILLETSLNTVIGITLERNHFSNQAYFSYVKMCVFSLK